MSTKLQRWIDLLAALLRHRMPVTFTELALDVPAYLADESVAAGKPSASLKRTFERDKVELRELGVPIESIGEEGSDESAYRLRTKDFYLPYLGIVSARGLERPETVDRYGYRSLATLAFSPDELEAIVEGARRVAQAGDPLLAEEARSAIRKLAFDLPLGAADVPGETLIARPRPSSDPKTLAVLGDALFRRKRVELTYRAMQSGAPTERSVEPYGLFFVSGHWYLAARDTEKDALRNFRVNRVQSLRVNASRAGTADYEIPRSFSLREHAASRQAWEIGDGDLFDAVVEFRGTSGAVVAAAALGRSVDSASEVQIPRLASLARNDSIPRLASLARNDSSLGHSERRAEDPRVPSGQTRNLHVPVLRRFAVRRADSFARWLLSFAGEAVPVTPASLVNEYTSLVERTREVYA